MPNLTVAEAREKKLFELLIDYVALGIHRFKPTQSEAECEVDAASFALTYRDALLTAHDAEAVEGKWEVGFDAASLHPLYFTHNTETMGNIWCPDEATARLYANALNRADQRRKETPCP